MSRETNYEKYLRERLKDGEFRESYEKELRKARLAVQINQTRVRQGLTQEQLAKRMGTTQSAIARLEMATYNGYSMRTLERVAGALGCELRVELVPEIGKRPRNGPRASGRRGKRMRRARP